MFGDCPDDEALREGWSDFCDLLRDAGDHMFQDSFPTSPTERAEAFRYLTQGIPIALAFHFEDVTPLHPSLVHYFDPTRKQAGDNSDALNYGAWIDGRYSYRLYGNRGTAHWFAITALRPGGAAGWQSPYNLQLDCDALDLRTLRTEPDGSFEVWLSSEPHEGNWMPITSAARAIRIRQFFADWDTERPGDFRIERVGADPLEPPPPLTPEEVVHRLKVVGEHVRDSAKFWPDGLKGSFSVSDAAPNVFTVAMPDPEAVRRSRVDANPGGMYAECEWSLSPDEALLIEFRPQDAYFWSFQNETPWLTSFDYRWRLSGVNCKQVVHEPDGRCLVVVSTRDPGLPNWIDTGTFSRGRITYRGTLCDSPVPDFHTRVVRVDELAAVLPHDARVITRDGRADQLRRRAEGVARRFRL
jgi:hypothetical protein